MPKQIFANFAKTFPKEQICRRGTSLRCFLREELRKENFAKAYRHSGIEETKLRETFPLVWHCGSITL